MRRVPSLVEQIEPLNQVINRSQRECFDNVDVSSNPPYTPDYFVDTVIRTFKNDIHLRLLRKAAAAVS